MLSEISMKMFTRCVTVEKANAIAGNYYESSEKKTSHYCMALVYSMLTECPSLLIILTHSVICQ